MKIRIITDDFTSATDGLAAFAEQGWAAAVVMHSGQSIDAQVISTSTDSRTKSEAEAAQSVSNWAQRWRSADILVKQFDSTLRGPLVAEVLAARQASGREKMLLVPAFPAAGRITRQGCVWVDGVPVHQTEFAQDPLNPVRESSLLALFAQHGIALQLAKTPLHAVTLLADHEAVLMDAENDQALLDVVRLASSIPSLLWAGSTGLLHAMAMSLPSPASPSMVWVPAKQPAVVIGSRNPKARKQLAMLNDTALPVFSTPNEAGVPETLTHALTLQAAQSVIDGRCDALVVTGGETASKLAIALQARSLQVIGEIEPGIPLCRLNTPYGMLPMITKAGGFGGNDILLRCVRVLTGAQP